MMTAKSICKRLSIDCVLEYQTLMSFEPIDNDDSSIPGRNRCETAK